MYMYITCIFISEEDQRGDGSTGRRVVQNVSYRDIDIHHIIYMFAYVHIYMYIYLYVYYIYIDQRKRSAR